jgi:hypothetical protein
MKKKKHTKKQKIFKLITILVVALVPASAAIVYYRLNASKPVYNPLVTHATYSGPVDVWLSATVDDDYVNHYKLDYKLPKVLLPCEGGGPSVNKQVTYDGPNMYVSFEVSQSKPKRETKTSSDGLDIMIGDGGGCLATPRAAQASIDIDKGWLLSGNAGYIVVNTKKYNLTVDIEKHVWFMRSNSKMPLYPDRVAMISVFPCHKNVKQELVDYAKKNNLQLADEVYPNLKNLYQRPNEELHVIYDDQAKKLEANRERGLSFSNEYSPQVRCSPRVKPPIVHLKLNDPGLSR